MCDVSYTENSSNGYFNLIQFLRKVLKLTYENQTPCSLLMTLIQTTEIQV